MRYILGLDTGGTFTDAAIINGKTGELLAKAKAPTTRHDLSIGLGGAISRVVDKIDPQERPLITVSACRPPLPPMLLLKAWVGASVWL